MAKVEKDYEELLGLLNKHNVKYCVVGAFAVAFYAVPRYTKDLDILIEPTIANAENIIKALKKFGFGSLKLSSKDFVKKGTIIQLGYEPVRIDLLTAIEGVSFDKVWKNKKKGFYGHEEVHFIGLDDLIKNKQALKQDKDKMDLGVLLKAKNIDNRK